MCAEKHVSYRDWKNLKMENGHGKVKDLCDLSLDFNHFPPEFCQIIPDIYAYFSKHCFSSHFLFLQNKSHTESTRN